MAMKTKEEIDELKSQWLADGIWDIEDTEGFEEHRKELLAFRIKHEKQMEGERMRQEALISEKARKLGVEGLYRLILHNEELVKRHAKAIEALADGKTTAAYRYLQGWEDY